MSTSIMQTRQECYICRAKYNVSTVRGLEEHHVLNGPLRPMAERYGLKVWLCHRHHNEPGYSAHLTTTAAFGSKKRHRPLLRPDMDTSAGWLKPERII